MDYEKQRDELIDKYGNRFRSDILRFESKIFETIMRVLMPDLDYDRDTDIIKLTSTNILRTKSAIDRAFDQVFKQERPALVKRFIKDLAGLMEANTKYFASELPTVKNLEGVESRVIQKMNTRLGITVKPDTADKIVTANGYLGQVFAMEEPISQIRKEAMKSIAAGVTRKEMERKLQLFIKTGEIDKGKLSEGRITAYMRTELYDAHAQYDSMVQKEYADELELNWARYSGGLIKTSRSFCNERNDQVFNRKEIKAWENLEWSGKNKNYDPFRDRGGHNCRHKLSWISDQRAKRLLGEEEFQRRSAA